MRTWIIEVTSPAGNWGKFLIGRPDVEWRVRSGLFEVARKAVDEVEGEGSYDAQHGPNFARPGSAPLLAQLGWTPRHIWVLDLQTGEGACFSPGGSAHNDLDKHRIWVCPLFEPFLEWLYEQPLETVEDFDALPQMVEIDIPLETQGYRRPGPWPARS